MSNDVIQANYEVLESIAARFGSESERVEEMNGRLQSALRSLQNGGWVGQGANAFFDEMDSVVLPGAARLTEALTQARTVTLEVKHIIQEAEEEAARPFGARAADGAPAADGAAPAPPDVSGGPQPSTPIPTADIFNDAYMDNMIGKSIQGAGDPGLIDAMRTLSGNPTPAELDRALDQIAAARGVPRADIQASYDRYVELRAEAQRIGAAGGKSGWEPLNETLHPNFMGSTVQLRYGQVVGDALGIDPVFGSMLNPTGGLVGGGNISVQFPTEHPVGYHGVFHDAAGYLYNYHNMGPGYNYLGLENRDTSSPLTGQQAGIAHWNEKMGVGGLEATVSNGIGAGIGKAQDAITWVDNTVDTVKAGVGRAVDAVQETFEDVQEGVTDFWEWAF